MTDSPLPVCYDRPAEKPTANTISKTMKRIKEF